MNINDPFGRMQNRRERDYQSLCDSLRKAGLDNVTDAELLKDNMAKRCRIGLSIIVPFTIALTMLLPGLWMFTLFMGVLISSWLFNMSKRGQKYVERYIQEELTDQDEDGSSTF